MHHNSRKWRVDSCFWSEEMRGDLYVFVSPIFKNPGIRKTSITASNKQLNSVSVELIAGIMALYAVALLE